MPAVLICGDTLRSPELRHEVPLGIGDPFLYLETDGRRAVLTNVLEVDRIAQQAPELERLLGEQLGRDELIAEGLSYAAIDRELYLRATRGSGSPPPWCRRTSRSRWPIACGPRASS